MYILSLKATKGKLALLIATPIVLIATIVVILAVHGQNENTMAKLTGQTDANRISFLSTYGWEVKAEPKEVQEVVIPDVFDQVYLNYNEIQKVDGFNLQKYSGCRVKRWTYEVTNYPDKKQNVVANVLVYNGKIIGGDICSVALNGFMHAFSQKSTDETDT